MDDAAVCAFATWARRCLVPDRARRYVELVASEKGRRKLLRAFDHDLAPALRPEGLRSQGDAGLHDRPCFVYQAHLGFGVPARNLQEAYERVGGLDGWLVVLDDGSAGILCPEDGPPIVAG